MGRKYSEWSLGFISKFRNSNTKLTDIEKFNYLWSKLQGEAKRAVSGLTLSSDNYSLLILEEKFGTHKIDILYNL